MSDPFVQPVNPETPKKPTLTHEQALTALQFELDQLTLAVFNSPEGDRLLEKWKAYYVGQPVIIPGAPAGTNEMREGRNAFIRAIEMIVKRARTEK